MENIFNVFCYQAFQLVSDCDKGGDQWLTLGLFNLAWPQQPKSLSWLGDPSGESCKGEDMGGEACCEGEDSGGESCQGQDLGGEICCDGKISGGESCQGEDLGGESCSGPLQPAPRPEPHKRHSWATCHRLRPKHVAHPKAGCAIPIPG